MHDDIQIVHFIKEHALQTRLFRDLCKEIDAEYTDLLYHNDVRWLSRGNVLGSVSFKSVNSNISCWSKALAKSLPIIIGLHISHTLLIFLIM